MKVNTIKLGIASGVVSVLVYVGCAILMMIVGKDSLVSISNLLFHGMEFENIIRETVPLTETLLGLLVSFLFWGIVGYLVGILYNLQLAKD